MEIKDLKSKEKVPEIKVRITKMLDTETTNSGNTVRPAIINDESGQAILKLWNNQTELFNEGDEVVIKNGFCKEFKEELEVTTGFHGTITKV